MSCLRVVQAVVCTTAMAASLTAYSAGEGSAEGAPSVTPAHARHCHAVYVIVARGTNEPPGEGHTAKLVRKIARRSTQPIDDVAVDYPAVAKLPGDDRASIQGYARSSSLGAAAVRRMLKSEVRRCPRQKIVLLGYSQGAQVIGDAIAGGGGGVLGPEVAPVPHRVSRHVTAVIQMGDPRHMAGLPFDVGTSRRNGLFPRAADQQLTRFGRRVRSYCDAGDPFCDSGKVFPIHLTYLAHYGNAATRFVVKAIGG